MVNVDLSPSTILGSGMVVAGLSLWQIRASKPELSKDMDVVFSSVGVLVGGILIFQGWRLDPLLLFGQLLTVSTAISFAIEAVNLRRKLNDQDGMGALPYDADYRAQGDAGGFNRQEPRGLPPPQATQFSSMWDDDRYADAGNNRVYDATPEAAYDYYGEPRYADQSREQYRDGYEAPLPPSGGAGQYYGDEFPDWGSTPENKGRESRPWMDEIDSGRPRGSFDADISRQPGARDDLPEDYGRGYMDLDSQAPPPPPPPSDFGGRGGSSNRPRQSMPDKRRSQNDDIMDDWGV